MTGKGPVSPDILASHQNLISNCWHRGSQKEEMVTTRNYFAALVNLTDDEATILGRQEHEEESNDR